MLYYYPMEVYIMEQWLEKGAPYADELARADREYRQMLAQHETLVNRFDELMLSLPPEQRELILEYLNLSVDMEYRKTQLVWLNK